MKPGTEFLCAVRVTFGISIDWLLTGEGNVTGRNSINLDLLRTIRLQIAVARSTVIDGNPTAKAILLLIQDGHLQETETEPDIKAFLDTIVPVNPDCDLELELYNGQSWTTDPNSLRRNLLSAAIAHFEARKPIDKVTAVAPEGKSPTNLQINTGSYNKIAGRDFHER